MTRTTVVIVSYRSRSTIDRALTPLRDATERGEIACVVVDNAGGDGTAEYVAREYPSTRMIDAGANLGFGRGCNLGAKDATTEFLLFLNPDAALAPPELDKLLAFMDEHPDVGICAPSFADQPQNAGILTRPRDVVAQAWGLPSYPDRRLIVPGDEPFRTNWVCGAALLIRRKLFEEIGGFDPRFFLYFEETDLCRRASERGFEIWVVPAAVSTHEAGVSARNDGGATYSGNIAVHYFQSRFYYLGKHHGYASAVAADLLELLAMLGKVALGRGERGRKGIDTLRRRIGYTILKPPRPLA